MAVASSRWRHICNQIWLVHQYFTQYNLSSNGETTAAHLPGFVTRGGHEGGLHSHTPHQSEKSVIEYRIPAPGPRHAMCFDSRITVSSCKCGLERWSVISQRISLHLNTVFGKTNLIAPQSRIPRSLLAVLHPLNAVHNCMNPKLPARFRCRSLSGRVLSKQRQHND